MTGSVSGRVLSLDRQAPCVADYFHLLFEPKASHSTVSERGIFLETDGKTLTITSAWTGPMQENSLLADFGAVLLAFL